MINVEEIKKQRMDFLKKEMPNHTKKLTDEELSYFVTWASECIIFFMKENEEILFNALRGFLTGIEFNKR